MNNTIASTNLSPQQLERAYQTALSALLAEQTPAGYWVGELSTSALSTATAVCALREVDKQLSTSQAHARLITGGLQWLADHQNEDDGWGDTIRSISNISTTVLCRCAFGGPAARQGPYARVVERADTHLAERYGNTPGKLAEAIRARYGKDRTFATPILTTAALAGLVSWQEVPPLPFEMACFPQSWFRYLNLRVVSYALPALIAIGQAVYHHRPPLNPIARVLRWLARSRSLHVLQTIQPSSGGFLEAIPLTSFVTLSLASIGKADHPVAREGVRFIRESVRDDGSWAIDSNLSVWVTTLSIQALASGAGEVLLRDASLAGVRDWLLRQQFQQRHPYTGADPGAWGWTHLPGSVPDADDTPGALLALSHLGHDARDAANLGIRWILDLQNRDGGWPTFCRGWGNLPFDRSGADLTAHALRALHAWRLQVDSRVRLEQAQQRGLDYLRRSQRSDGSWLPLWFGNQFAHDDENPTYGTARVLAAYRDLAMMNTDPGRRGVDWLVRAQNADGGWGGAAGVASSMEETALAVEVLLDAGASAAPAVNKGLAWLVQRVDAGGLTQPTPIGFYFAKLWYYEKLYPVIFTVAALGRARLSRRHEPAHS